MYAKEVLAPICNRSSGHADTAGLSDRQALQRVLSERHNRYLARQLCWVLTVEGLETYLLYPRDPSDWDLLIEAIRATPSPMDLDVVIGTLGPIATPELCNGLMVLCRAGPRSRFMRLSHPQASRKTS